MKKRKKNLLQRTTAVLLSAMLVVGAVPMNVFAQENVEQGGMEVTSGAEKDTGTEVPTAPPAENPVTSPTETPTEDPVTPPAETPTEDPVTPPTETPTEDPVTPPAETPTEDPVTPPVEAPTEDPVTPPVEAPTEDLAELPVEAPAENGMEDPAETEQSVSANTVGYAMEVREAVPAAADSMPITGNGWKFEEVDGRYVVTIENDTGMDEWNESTPNTNHGKQIYVTPPGGTRSRLFEAAKEVVICDGVTAIDDGAFASSLSLEKVTISDTVTSIGVEAFRYCPQLQEIVIPNSVRAMGKLAFASCSAVTSVTISENIEEIANQAFYGLVNLKSITIPASVKKIQLSAFNHCDALETVKMQGTEAPELEERVFMYCGFVTAGTQGIEVPAGYETAYQVAWQTWKDYIVMDANLLAVGKGWEISKDYVLTIKDNEGMADWSTEEAGKGKNIQITITENGGMASALYTLVKETVISSDVTMISDRAFSACGNMEKVTIPDSVTSIGAEAFRSCFKLQEIVIPDNVRTMGSLAFAHCKAITSVTIPESIGEIGSETFFGCENLKSITIPASVTTIGNYAFAKCAVLETVKVQRTQPPAIGTNIFGECGFVTAGQKAIEVPAGCEGSYQTVWAMWVPYMKEVSHNPGGDSGEGGGSGSGSGSGEGGSGSGGEHTGSGSGGNDNAGGGDGGSGSDIADAAEGSSGGSGLTASTVPDRNIASAGEINPVIGEPRVKTENQGSIHKEVVIQAENTLDTIIATPTGELADMLLSETEKQQAAAGTDVRLVLDVKDAAGSVSSTEQTLVETKLKSSLPGFTLGEYLDISLYKLVGGNRTDITETADKILVTIAVPERLRNKDSQKMRIFAVMCVHNGQVEILNDLDSGDDIVSVAVDRFSTYAIVYKDVAKTGTPGTEQIIVKTAGNGVSGKTGTAQKKDNEPGTGDNTPVEMCATLTMISGLTYLLLYFTERRHGMTEETKKELVSRLIGWAKRGGKLRRLLALAAIFFLLVYYHSIGKQTSVQWEEVYGE